MTDRLAYAEISAWNRCQLIAQVRQKFFPGSLIEPGMTPDLDDHLRRAFKALGRCVSMVILHDLAALIGEGRLLPESLRSLLREHVDPRTPIVLAQDDLDRQREWFAV